jgi:predicted nucleic-acid-binding protein
MPAVDTNILVRLIAQDNAQQVQSAKAFIEHGVWVPLLALAEAVWVLGATYRNDRSGLIAAIEMFLGLRQVTLQDADVVAAALKLFRGNPALSFTDCLMLELARKAGHLPLGTFDKALAKADGAQRI